MKEEVFVVKIKVEERLGQNDAFRGWGKRMQVIKQAHLETGAGMATRASRT